MTWLYGTVIHKSSCVLSEQDSLYAKACKCGVASRKLTHHVVVRCPLDGQTHVGCHRRPQSPSPPSNPPLQTRVPKIRPTPALTHARPLRQVPGTSRLTQEGWFVQTSTTSDTSESINLPCPVTNGSLKHCFLGLLSDCAHTCFGTACCAMLCCLEYKEQRTTCGRLTDSIHGRCEICP